MAYDYDDANIFAKILRGEIPNDTVLETEHTLAFRDIQPKAPSHVLVIPKGKYVTFDDFAENAPAEEIMDFMRAVAQVTKQEGLSTGSGGHGFRAITNAGNDGVQEVPHFHLHILGGRVIGPMVMQLRD
ncbi:HIT domain-containing protein [Paracoccus albus]|uniref:HIT domain-containing protein n=1 Tax=Paracoccus albus TaxID=3017784 RepID=UPI0022F065D7|nr:HIT domain-containing protein [Paracoccus albus]WBU59119.1 HIT domain-containing protein [Paracoccus albus]